MRTKVRLVATRGRLLKIGILLGVALALGLAGPLDAASAAPAGPAAPRTELLSWGLNAWGNLGNGKVTDSDLPVVVKMPAGVKVAQERAGGTFSVALTVGHGVYAWGSNLSGQLGVGRTKSIGYVKGSHVPVQVHLPRLVGTQVAQVRAGSNFGLALTAAGQVWAWGEGGGGEIGNGQTSNAHVPVHVPMPGGAKIASISAGCLHSLARTTSGEVLAWGDNKYGELGDDSTADSDVPVRVELPRNFKAVDIAAGCFHSLAVDASGKIFAWGSNQDGQLGDGQPNLVNPLPIEIFPQVPGTAIGKVTQLYGGCEHTLALTSKGVVLAWGDDTVGQLGIAPAKSVTRPTRVATLAGRGVTAIAAGCFTSYARTSSGRALAWGEGDSGELGNATFGDVKIPVGVHLPAGDSATGIESGPSSSTAFVIVTTS
jgi:alpha-tubulin suppressor-like RCC1 family protein